MLGLFIFRMNFNFTPSFNIRSGYLFVRSLTPITDPFLSAMNGGYSVGYGNDKRASNKIGSEVLLGVDYKLTGKKFQPMVRIDASLAQHTYRIYKSRIG